MKEDYGKYVCGICGASHYELDEYLACVSKCGETLKAKQKAEAEKERLEKVNAALNKIKEAKKYYEDQLAKFEEEYPEEYKINFSSKDTCKCSNDCKNNSSDSKEKSVKILCEKKSDEDPKIRMRVNGKDVSAEKLFEDPDCRYIAKMLGLI